MPSVTSINRGWPCREINNVASQRWTLVAAGNGYFKVKNVNSNDLLTVSSAGTQLVQSTDTSTDSQLWKMVNVD